ncbi:MAG: lysine biosynthesis protein LysX [Thermomicrobiaceae bacterium]
MAKPNVGILLSQLREEEKLLLRAFATHGIDPVRLTDRKLQMELTDLSWLHQLELDVVLDRCLAHGRAGIVLQALNVGGVRSVNTRQAAVVADDKVECSLILGAAGIPTLRTFMAFTVDSALEALDQIGYPAVLKPVAGSWGRLLGKVNSPGAARALLEHKRQLGSYHHSMFYIQEYVEKPGRDLRIFIVGDDIVAGSYRSAEHWVTNVARGAVSAPCPITPEIAEISLRAAKAIGVEIAGVDLVETTDGLKVIEVNGGAEFKGLMSTTDCDIAQKIVDYVVESASSRKSGSLNGTSRVKAQSVAGDD